MDIFYLYKQAGGHTCGKCIYFRPARGEAEYGWCKPVYNDEFGVSTWPACYCFLPRGKELDSNYLPDWPAAMR